MSFFLDAFVFFAVGVAMFLVTSWIRRKLWPKWSSGYTAILGILVTLIFGSMSVLLYLDDNGTSPIFIFLKVVLQMEDPSGGYVMLHTNATGVTKADMPWPLVVILFALYPAWVYLGFRTAVNMSDDNRASDLRRGVVLGRAAAHLGLALGGILMLFGLVRFPGGILRQSNLAAFMLTVGGIGLILLGSYAASMPRTTTK